MRRNVLVGIAALLALFGAPGGVAAKTFEVTRHNDPAPGKCKSNDCSLREALIAANKHDGKDVVLLPDRARYNLARPNATPLIDEDASAEGDLDATGPLTLSHAGKGKATIDGNKVDRVLEVQAPTLIKRIKITGGGNVSDEPFRVGLRTSVNGSGGGIESHSRLTVKRSAVVANSGASTGGGINVEPGFEPGAGPASLRLVRSTVARNRTIQGTGGGVYAIQSNVTIARSRINGNRPENAGGGVVASTGSFLKMSRTTVAGNVAGSGFGGVYLYEASGRITGSTISGNSAGSSTAQVGGVEYQSHGPTTSLTITNSTIAGNTAAEGAGGIRASGAQAALELRNVTVARNDGDSDDDGGNGGGLLEDGSSVRLVNSIIAQNRLGTTANDCDGVFNTGGGNLLSTADGCNLLGTPARPDLFGVNPKIGRLKRNGGPTQTIALRKGSPAIGKAVKAEAPNRDQRGVKRDNKPDIGAYER